MLGRLLGCRCATGGGRVTRSCIGKVFRDAPLGFQCAVPVQILEIVVLVEAEQIFQ